MRINPVLPDCFYEMAICGMPASVIIEWWEKPYIETRGDAFAVMCLDGGAWDRPTLKGIYDTIEEAEKSISNG